MLRETLVCNGTKESRYLIGTTFPAHNAVPVVFESRPTYSVKMFVAVPHEVETR
jgi:hypothetical protein